MLDLLGEGGMGRVYRARDTRLGRVVAVKFLRQTSVANQSRQVRLLCEAKAEAALNHPNIATLLDVGEADVDDPELVSLQQDGSTPAKIPYLVIEFVPGCDLRKLLASGPLPIGELLRIGRQIASALHAAHLAGIVHRDLKPGNIRLTPDGRIKILDFGLAMFVEGEEPTTDEPTGISTLDGAVVGTLPYLAPEQAAGGAVDARADLFSLGVLLYEMASGKLPFRGASILERIRAVVEEDPAPLGELAQGLPEDFVTLVHRLLAKDPSQRPHDASEVERELAALSRDISEAPTSPTLKRMRKPRAPRAARSLLTLLSGDRSAAKRSMIALSLFATLAAALLWLRDSRSLGRAHFLLAEGRKAEAITLADPNAAPIAVSLFELATRLRPEMAEAWAALGDALIDAYGYEPVPELLDRARAAARRAQELDPDGTATRLVMARIHLHEGRTNTAIRLLDSIPKEGTDLSVLERRLSEAWERKGEWAQAEEHMLHSALAQPDAWTNWNALGSFRVRANDYAGAREAFVRATAVAPLGVLIPEENLATLLYLEGRYQESFAAYERLHGKTVLPESESNLGVLLFMNDRVAEAAQAFRTAIRKAPDNPVYHRNLGDSLMRLGSETSARAEYSTALRLVDDRLRQSPGDLGLQLDRLLYLARTGDCAAALRDTARLAESPPPDAHAAHRLAQSFALCGDRRAALGQIRRLLDLGFPPALLLAEDELSALRDDLEFQLLVERSPDRNAANPGR